MAKAMSGSFISGFQVQLLKEAAADVGCVALRCHAQAVWMTTEECRRRFHRPALFNEFALDQMPLSELFYLRAGVSCHSDDNFCHGHDNASMMILEKTCVDESLASQASEIEAMLARTGYSAEEACQKLELRLETFRKYREGYQKAGAKLMVLVRALQSPHSRANGDAVREPTISYDAKRAKAAVDYILNNGDKAEISIFLAMIQASEKEVSARKPKE